MRRRDGAVAVQFAIIALPLAILSLGLIDVNRASMSKRTLQDALDAASLLVARSSVTTDAAANSLGNTALNAQLAASGQGSLVSATFKFGGASGSTVIADAQVAVDPVVANLWLQGSMKVGAHSEVVRSSANLEVSLVLDVTGSMDGSRITDLKAAAGDLVDLVVQDVQTPYYSKVAIVPYSMGVNLGSANAATARGTVPAGKTISGASWAVGSSKGISGATKAYPTTITANGHGFNNGDYVWIDGVKGMTQLNGKAYIVANKTTNTFQLTGVDSRYYSSYQSGSNDKVTKCQVKDCEVVVTSSSHGFKNNDYVYITGVGGMTQINSTAWKVTSVSTNTYQLDGSVGPDYGTYSSGGKGYCTDSGCEYYRFTNMYGSPVVQQVSTCVTERQGTDAYKDVAPATTPVGLNYPSSGNPCIGNQVVGLSANKTSLKTAITDLAVGGSTAGQIGLAWGWYTVSPNFSSIFGGTSQPAAYGTKDLIKVVILMTDGEFNTAYCNGVIAQDSGSGSGSNSAKVNCNASKGNGYTQAAALCSAMKTQKIVVYTVGFDISDSDDVTNLLSGCATSARHFYQPSNGTDLKEAFKAIGKDISNLRISK
ncbi:MAG: pilus assembly protein TadG [Caulobacter sp.]|nr:pilus assembly protein TadG [Caulobacter sp.]